MRCASDFSFIAASNLSDIMAIAILRVLHDGNVSGKWMNAFDSISCPPQRGYKAGLTTTGWKEIEK